MTHYGPSATDQHERSAWRFFGFRNAAWICHKSHRVRRNTRQVTEALGPSRDSAAGASHFSQFNGRLFVLVDQLEAAPTALRIAGASVQIWQRMAGCGTTRPPTKWKP